MGYVYLLHFDRPVSERHTCQHYIGWSADLPSRLALHRTGAGARLTQVAKERGIGFTLARTWRGDRNLERSLKKRHNSKKLCYCCNGSLEFTLNDVEPLEF